MMEEEKVLGVVSVGGAQVEVVEVPRLRGPMFRALTDGEKVIKFGSRSWSSLLLAVDLSLKTSKGEGRFASLRG